MKIFKKFTLFLLVLTTISIKGGEGEAKPLDPVKVHDYLERTQKDINIAKDQANSLEDIAKKRKSAEIEGREIDFEKEHKSAKERVNLLEKNYNDLSTLFTEFEKNPSKAKRQKINSVTNKIDDVTKELNEKEKLVKQIKQYTEQLATIVELSTKKPSELPIKKPLVSSVSGKNYKDFNEVLKKPSILNKKKRIAELENIAAQMFIKAANEVDFDPKINLAAIERALGDNLKRGKTERSESALSAALSPSIGKRDYGLVDSLSKNYNKVINALKRLKKTTNLPSELTADSLEAFSNQSQKSTAQPLRVPE